MFNPKTVGFETVSFFVGCLKVIFQELTSITKSGYFGLTHISYPFTYLEFDSLIRANVVVSCLSYEVDTTTGMAHDGRWGAVRNLQKNIPNLCSVLVQGSSPHTQDPTRVCRKQVELIKLRRSAANAEVIRRNNG